VAYRQLCNLIERVGLRTSYPAAEKMAAVEPTAKGETTTPSRPQASQPRGLAKGSLHAPRRAQPVPQRAQRAAQRAGARLQLMRKRSSGRGWQSRTAQAMTLRPTTVSRICARCMQWAPRRSEPAAVRR